ncbi:MAG TPA: ATP-dependent DNA helicase RecG [Patescibacteria group bacterium]|nr:ATP-dependent DNA helicase RecG [Patescibacteria group bacterium]
MDLQTKVLDVSRIYKVYASRLEKLGIRTLEDFLYHIPFRYDDYSVVSKISQVQPGETVTIQGKIINIKNIYTRRFKIQTATVEDDTGTINITWFNQPYITKYLKIGDKVSLSGKIDFFKNKTVIQSPEFEVMGTQETIHTGRLVPVYPETRGVSSKWLRRQVYKILSEHKDEINEFLPEKILKDNGLFDLQKSFEQSHFPKDLETAEKAKQRLSFDELFFLRLSSLTKKKEWEEKYSQKPMKITRYKDELDIFLKKLPFELTNAQKRVIEEIFKDINSDKPMNRLLQGEVGSGKTVVAAVAMYVCFLNGYKSILMTPTEILANQHYKTISDLLRPFKIKIVLITGSSKSKENADIYVGTHALLHKKETIENLRLIVIDEQQRFGVEQRSIIRKKGENPNLLTMTATPIPRTVALVMYGNLSLSFLDEMPKNRKQVKTWLVPPTKRENAYKWIAERVENKDQVFIICPFIEESETMQTVRAATVEFEKLKSVFLKAKLGLLHGKLKSKEKNEVLQKFKEGKIDILVTTPVVEVGIDIPNATVMLVEEAERFGLAQLHQLRGRVGRGEKESYCLLFTQSTNPLTLRRIKAMETLQNGAELAELDLKLRGPGQLFGTMQHGVPNLRIATFSDTKLLETTKREAEKIFPEINKYPKLYKKVEEITGKEVSPD